MGMYEDWVTAGKAEKNLKETGISNLEAEKMMRRMEKAPTADNNAEKSVKEGDSFLHKHFPKVFP